MDVRSARTGIRDDYIVQRRKHLTRWISYWFGVCMIMVLLSLAGCGSKKDGTDVAVVDVAEKFWKVYEESEQDEIVGKKFFNDSNSYCMEYNEEKTETVLVQRKIDGTSPQRYPEEEVLDILCVTNQELYYKKWEDITSDTVLWRVPIQKTQAGDVLHWKEREALATSDLDNFCLVSDSCVIFEDDNLIHKLELPTGKTVPLCEELDWTRPEIVYGRGGETICMEGYAFIRDGGNLYCLDPVQEEVCQIYWGQRDLRLKEGYYECNNSIVSSGDRIYFTHDFETVWQYQLGEEQAVCAVSREQFLELLQRPELQDYASYRNFSITGMELYQNQLYLTVQDREKEEMGIHWCLLHSSVDDFQELQHDSTVTEYLEEGWRKRAVSEEMVSTEGGWVDTEVWEQALYLYQPIGMDGIRDGKILFYSRRLTSPAMSMVHYEGSAAYDIKTRKILERPGIIKVY